MLFIVSHLFSAFIKYVCIVARQPWLGSDFTHWAAQQQFCVEFAYSKLSLIKKRNALKKLYAIWSADFQKVSPDVYTSTAYSVDTVVNLTNVFNFPFTLEPFISKPVSSLSTNFADHVTVTFTPSILKSWFISNRKLWLYKRYDLSKWCPGHKAWIHWEECIGNGIWL